MNDCLNVVITGEVDSGKSTLIGRFLYEMGLVPAAVMKDIENTCQKSGGDFEFAYLLDSFEEERNNQMTIDSTQAFLKIKKGREFIFIDVPGHEELIKNMLCGSSYADAAIIVVDVQKSVEEQTKRHAFILQLLGIGQIILVFNKMDSAAFNEDVFNKVKNDAAGVFKNINLVPKCFIPVSAKGGDNLLKKSKNMPWYDGAAVIEALGVFSRKGKDEGFRFPVQDIYNLATGEKIIVGEVISGQIKKGEKVNILPQNKECIVKEIRGLKKDLPVARAPQSIGLILDDMNGASRGQVICKALLPSVTREFTAKIFCVHPVKIGQTLIFRCATQESPAKIKKINGIWDTASFGLKAKEEFLGETDIAEVIIAVETPVVVEKYKGLHNLGRFILQSDSKEINAVGVIIDANSY